jgi:hypothetical protein
MADRVTYRSRQDCEDLIRRLGNPWFSPVVMLFADGKETLHRAACEHAYYLSAEACGIPETEAHAVLQELASRGRLVTAADYRKAWSLLLDRTFAAKP